MLTFHKYHGLGNDYLVYPAKEENPFSGDQTRVICHRNYGIGSDGILLGPLPSENADFRLRILNPDGSEAEKSGNGLRIFARYLFDEGLVSHEPFKVETLGGTVECRIHPEGDPITVEMGIVSFCSSKIPVSGDEREVLEESIVAGEKTFSFSAATIGNPHCVVPLPSISATLAKTYGPILEKDARFPNRTNVQFLEVIDRSNIRIEIWERGAGYTLASGSSSSAAGAVAKRLGLVDSPLQVHMPGGIIQLEITDEYDVRMTGSVTRVGSMQIEPEAFTVDSSTIQY